LKKTSESKKSRIFLMYVLILFFFFFQLIEKLITKSFLLDPSI